MSVKNEKAKNLKLLAPVGDWACLRTAVQAGADCVYFGIQGFNMRSTGAKNFVLSDLNEIVKYCKKKSVETYLTVNTVIYDEDLPLMREIIQNAKDAGCSGVIVSDFAAIEYAKKIGMPMSISTQLSVSNIESVKYFAQYSDRIILARELTLEQIREIVQQIEKENVVGPSGNLVEIEIFGHGALCVAVSGRCSMSLYCYDKSANRGECTQICRRKYKVVDLETDQELVIDNEHVMSPKDLCTIGLLPEIVNAGVKVLKLEGRGRSPEYVDTVVTCYKKARQAIVDGTFSQELVNDLNEKLGTVFNRGLSQGMYLGRNLDEWAKGSGNQAKQKRIFVGKVIHFFPKKSVAFIRVLGNVQIHENTECLIIGEKTGLVRFSLKGIVVNEKRVKSIKQNDEFTVEILNKRVRKNDEVYILNPI